MPNACGIFGSYKQDDGSDALLIQMYHSLKPLEVWVDKMRGEERSDTQVKCRYALAFIPKRTVKIVVTNAKDAWPRDPYGQLLGRRISQLEIQSPLF